MKKLLTLTALACLSLATIAGAVEVMDGWNVDETPIDGNIFAAPSNYAIEYVPAVDYDLYRVEFFATASAYIDPDEFTVQIMGDFDGIPDGNILATATTPMVNGEPRAFMGTDFDEPLFLLAGQTYWVIYFAMPWSPVSASEDGVGYPTMFSGDQIHWDPVNPWNWMAKLWGEPLGVGVESVSLSQVKSLFQ